MPKFFFSFSFPPKRHLLTCGGLLAALTAFKLGNLAMMIAATLYKKKFKKKKKVLQFCHALFNKVVALKLSMGQVGPDGPLMTKKKKGGSAPLQNRPAKIQIDHRV